jgi:hypothetical protein
MKRFDGASRASRGVVAGAGSRVELALEYDDWRNEQNAAAAAIAAPTAASSRAAPFVDTADQGKGSASPALTVALLVGCTSASTGTTGRTTAVTHRSVLTAVPATSALFRAARVHAPCDHQVARCPQFHRTASGAPGTTTAAAAATGTLHAWTFTRRPRLRLASSPTTTTTAAGAEQDRHVRGWVGVGARRVVAARTSGRALAAGLSILLARIVASSTAQCSALAANPGAGARPSPAGPTCAATTFAAFIFNGVTGLALRTARDAFTAGSSVAASTAECGPSAAAAATAAAGQAFAHGVDDALDPNLARAQHETARIWVPVVRADLHIEDHDDSQVRVHVT